MVIIKYNNYGFYLDFIDDNLQKMFPNVDYGSP